jgi:hypothetical protein
VLRRLCRVPGGFVFWAIATHAWYREKFGDYLRERRIRVPFIW